MFQDVRGLAVTAANADAVRHLDDVVHAYLGFRRDTGNLLKRSLAADPDMAMAHCLKGCFFKLFSVPALEGKARQSLEAARAAIAARGATERERRHADALEVWCDGDFPAATRCWEDVLLHNPRDLLALRLAHFTHFYLGDAVPMRDSAARVLSALNESTPGYGFALGVYAFGLEECGDYAAAERMGRRAVDINPGDIWAVHAVAHVMEMQGRPQDGIAWVDQTSSGWADCNNFAYHVWWHLCLCHLEREDYDEVLALYDGKVRADKSDEYLDITNAASLLWRLEDRGVDVGDRWLELAERCEGRADDHLLAFADMHFMMALAAAGQGGAAERMIASMRQAGDGANTQRGVLADIGLPLAEAILAYRRGEYDRAVDLLLPIRYAVRRLGGSHAQRDVFQQILIEAALRGGRFVLARALLAERIALRPNSPWNWKRQALALESLDDPDGAEAARQRAAALPGG